MKVLLLKPRESFREDVGTLFLLEKYMTYYVNEQMHQHVKVCFAEEKKKGRTLCPEM